MQGKGGVGGLGERAKSAAATAKLSCGSATAHLTFLKSTELVGVAAKEAHRYVSQALVR